MINAMPQNLLSVYMYTGDTQIHRKDASVLWVAYCTNVSSSELLIIHLDLGTGL